MTFVIVSYKPVFSCTYQAPTTQEFEKNLDFYFENIRSENILDFCMDKPGILIKGIMNAKLYNYDEK